MEQNTLFYIKIPLEYRALCQDISRMLTIQIITNYLLHLSNPKEIQFMSYDFIKTLLYLLIGIVAYWLVTTKIFNFTDDNKNTGFFYGKT